MEPEAPAQAEQTTIQRAAEMARAEIAAQSNEQPAVESESAPVGTGEIDWANEEARQAYLAERYLPKDDHERRMRDQKRNLEMGLKKAREIESRAARLAELDELRQSDPTAYAEVLNTDAEAAAIVLERASTIAPDVLAHATNSLAAGMAEKMFEVRPDLRPLFDDGGDWQVVTNPETGGIFGYIDRTAREQAVADFKKSKEYRDAIAEARRLGAQDAVPGLAVAAPSAESGKPVAADSAPTFKNNAQRAAWMAAREMNVRPPDLSKIGR